MGWCMSEKSLRAAVLLSSMSRCGGGVTEVARDLALRLHRGSKVTVDVLSLRDQSSTEDAASWGSVPLRTFATRRPHGFGYAPEMLSALRGTRPDLVHCHGLWMYPSLASVLCASKRMPHIVTTHGMLSPWALKISSWKKRIASVCFQHAHLRLATCLHAMCVPELEGIRTAGYTNPVCLIPNSVDLPEKRSGYLGDKGRFGLPSGSSFVRGDLITV